MVLKKIYGIYDKTEQLKRKLSHPYCVAVVVAAGSASRMKGTDKIFAILERLPVICRTLDVLERCSQVDEVVVVTREDAVERMRRLCPAYPKAKTVVSGGVTRLESVMAGLRAVPENTQLVAVHDGARPLVPVDVVERTVAKAAKFGAAAPAIPVKDTIKIASAGAVQQTPDRKTLYAVQTPQVFDVDLLRGALQNALEKGLAITDDCSAVEAMGMTVQLTDGSEENIKLTTPLDMELAEAILRRRKTK